MEELQTYVRGAVNYYEPGITYREALELESWLRTRVAQFLFFKLATIQVPSALARRSPSCPGNRIKAVSVSSMGGDCFRVLAMTLLRSQNALA